MARSAHSRRGTYLVFHGAFGPDVPFLSPGTDVVRPSEKSLKDGTSETRHDQCRASAGAALAVTRRGRRTPKV